MKKSSKPTAKPAKEKVGNNENVALAKPPKSKVRFKAGAELAAKV
jgi:hypothetical protein